MRTSTLTLRYGVLLSAVALLCSGISTAVYLLTKTQIDHVVATQQRELLTEVVPRDRFDNDLLASCREIALPDAPFLNKLYLAKKGEETTAYALQATAPDGYSGNIQLLIGIQPDGTLLGVRTLSHQETPGLGDKIDTRISDWITQFTGKQFRLDKEAQWAVKKDGGQFDQFTGATITPRAVVNNVRQTAKWVISQLAQQPTLVNQFSECERNER